MNLFNYLIIGDKIMKKTLSKEEALQYIIQNADKYNIPKAYIGADYLDDEKKYLYSIFFICGQIIEQQITFHNYKNNHCFKFANKVTPYYMEKHAEYTSELDYWRGRIEYFYLTKSNLDILLEFISVLIVPLWN